MLLPVSLKEGPDLPEDRPGQPEWDPFFREGRGKKSREARKQKRAAIPLSLMFKKEGKAAWKKVVLSTIKTVGSKEWRLMKTREKEMLEEQQQFLCPDQWGCST